MPLGYLGCTSLMDPIAFTSRRPRRPLLSLSVVASLAVALISTGGCSTDVDPFTVDYATGGTMSGGGGVIGGIDSSSGGGDQVIGSGANVGMDGAGGGATNAGGGPISGGGGGLGSGGSAPCVDDPPPYDATWPDATCEKWKTEASACEEPWFSEYCDVTCGRCVPSTGPDGSGGAPPEVCEDKAPPPDPEWPGATCESWRFEANACDEPWFSEYCDATCERCVPEGGSTVPKAPDCSGENLPNVTGGEGHTTRYWDCCQTHCAQQTGHKCSADGVSSTGDNTSSCNGGGSFACYDEAPRAISKCLAYGHIAKASPNCGACYRIQFTGQGNSNPNDIGSKLIQGKQMIVKVTNTGSDVGGSQFDLMVPGGGVGKFNACSNQWGTNDLGEQYGGFLSSCSGTHAQKKACVRQKCMNIPAGGARDGCLWFVDWFEVADNPKFTSTQTNCPF